MTDPASTVPSLPPIFYEVDQTGHVVPIPRDRLLQVTPAEVVSIAERTGWPVDDVSSLFVLGFGGTVTTHWHTPTALTDWARQQGRIRHVGNGIPAEGLPWSVWRTPYPGDLPAYHDYILNDRPDLAARIGELRNRVLGCDCEQGENCHAVRLAQFADIRVACELHGTPVPVGTPLERVLTGE